MKTREEFVSILLSLKGDLEARFHVKSIGIFGSVARNENTDKSDLDLIVDFSEPVGMFKFQELQDYLRDALNIDVDLTTPRALKPAIKLTVERDVLYV
ncbi:MAG: nucleotidyltransferase family protein [Methanomicrobiales archaeon]